MPATPRFDHIGLTVSDLDEAVAFFGLVGLEVEGRSFVEGEFLDTVCGLSGARTEIAMLSLPDGGTKLELSCFVRPTVEQSEQGSSDSSRTRATELGLRNVCFEVDDLAGTVDRLADAGYELVGGTGEWEQTYLMAYVHGPDGVILSLAESIG